MVEATGVATRMCCVIASGSGRLSPLICGAQSAGVTLLKQGARVVSPTGKQWTQAKIGNGLAGREMARHLRELGANTRGPSPLTKRDRSRFLSALDMALQAALREAAHS